MKHDVKALGLVDAFFKDAQVLEYVKGANILRAEDVPYGVYYLKSGYVRQYLLSTIREATCSAHRLAA